MSLATLKDKVEQLIEKAQNSGSDDTRFADLVANRTVNELDNSITKIGNYALGNCTFSVDVDLKNITSIGERALYYAKFPAETEIYCPQITSIGTEGLRYASNIVSISMPKITITGQSVFANINTLKNVYLPNLTTLRMSVFNSTAIETIDLPKLVSMDNGSGYQFNGCKNLKEFRFYNKIQGGIHSTTFSGCSNLLNICVPWAEGEVANAPWGATNANIHYNYTGEE